jgi:hypothetical protein
MKRPANDVIRIDIDGTRDPKANLSPEQLQAYAIAVLAYNLLEDQVEALFYVASHRDAFREEAAKLSRIDQKTDLILRVVETVGLDPEDVTQCREMMARFDVLKEHRNALVHCRLVDAPIGIGLKDGARDRVEILLTVEALTAFYTHMYWLEHVPIICTHSLHDGSSWQLGGRSAMERMSRWRGRGEEWFVRQVFAEMPSAD